MAASPQSPSPYATKVDGSLVELVQPTPDPLATPRSANGSHHPASRHNTSPALAQANMERQLQGQLLVLINQDRTSQGLNAYMLNRAMSAGARLHSQRMASCGMSHQCPGEDEPCKRMSHEGISWTNCGENVGYTSAMTWAGVRQIEQNMLAEQPPDDGHRLNLLNSSYNRVGVGIYVDAQGIVWVTEDFAG
ncbi:MAG TPA: CAP domain-containing protein [Ktedonobacteraceae bacterium]